MGKFNWNTYSEDREVLPVLVTDKEEKKDDLVIESAGGMDLGDAQMRAMAMSAVLAWIEEGDFSYAAFDAMLIGVADLDGDEDLTEDEEAVYEEIWGLAADAMLTLGADMENVQEFLDGESDSAGEKLGTFLAGSMSDIPSSDDEIISSFATGEDGAVMECAAMEGNEDMVLEAAFKKVKVIRGGKVVIKKKRISGKARLSAAQKAGLKKARRKANTSAAKLARRKAMKIRKSRGL